MKCISSVRKEICYRNQKPNWRFEDIVDFNQFKMVDKLSLLENLLENEELLSFLYNKIFPNRINELSCKLKPLERETKTPLNE